MVHRVGTVRCRTNICRRRKTLWRPFLVITVRVSSVSSPEKVATFFVSSLSLLFISLVHSGVAHYFRHPKNGDPLVGPLFVGAPVWPNMLNMPKSAAENKNDYPEYRTSTSRLRNDHGRQRIKPNRTVSARSPALIPLASLSALSGAAVHLHHTVDIRQCHCHFTNDYQVSQCELRGSQNQPAMVCVVMITAPLFDKQLLPTSLCERLSTAKCVNDTASTQVKVMDSLI